MELVPLKEEKETPELSLSLPGEDIVSRWLSSTQEENSHLKPILLYLDLRLTSLQRFVSTQTSAV